MTDRFKQLTLAEFIRVLDQFPFTRRINAVHMHHTWRPNRSQYQGLASIEAMWKYHTQHNGWSDIAQHITIAPDGTIWTGRNWNLAPASSSGHNGNSLAGPFMFEMIGDFDKGRDPFNGPQRHTALHVVAHVLRRFRLSAETLHFHNQMSVKTCPGSSIDYRQTVSEVAAIMTGLGRRETVAAEPELDEIKLTEALAALRYVPIASHTRNLGTEAVAEPAEEGMSRQEMRYVGEAEPAGARSLLGDQELSAAQRRQLRPHVINLDQGHFSPSGTFSTSAADVDAIFDTHLEKALADAYAAGRPLHLLLYAHGGLVSEKSGLDSARRYIPWWLENHVYPLYFVWETGLCGTLGAVIRGAGSREAARGVTDLTDRLVEKSVGKIGGLLWKNMKDSAEWAAAPDGGAHYVARRLQAFCQRHAAEVQAGQLRLHAAGHSAGSIFHAHFLPLAQQLGVPAFRTLHLLAPAIRVDEFKSRLAKLVGKSVQHLTLYTMRDELERADTCSLVYRKSLLYLIYYALEAARETPILGLEACLTADEQLSKLLGLRGTATSQAEVVWSKTLEATGRSSSASTSHGGFDDDGPTMESVLRRILATDAAVTPFPRTRDLADPWHEPVELPEELVLLAQAQAVSKAPARKGGRPAAQPASLPAANGHGRRRALCIGIDDYPAAPLAGCVADAKNWAKALQKRGFETTLLLNEAATRTALLDNISQLLSSSKAGDVLVVQYAGHGTTLPDLDRDEDDGRDEALCPHDYAAGAFVVDDDLRAVFQRVPAGVGVTCFMDCCHSGSNTRLLLTEPLAAPAHGHGSRPRFMRATAPMVEAHRDYRKKLSRKRETAAGKRAGMRVVNFTACQPWEVAYESDGSGDFTTRVLPLLSKAAADTSHEKFLAQVVHAFGKQGTPRQHPTLDCTDEALLLPLLQPLAATTTATPPRRARKKVAG